MSDDAKDAANHDANDPLLEPLRSLPTRKNAHDPLPKARAAFDRSFGRKPEASRALQGTSSVEPGAGGRLVARSVVPVALAFVVAAYLLWAFSAAFALQG